METIKIRKAADSERERYVGGEEIVAVQGQSGGYQRLVDLPGLDYMKGDMRKDQNREYMQKAKIQIEVAAYKRSNMTSLIWRLGWRAPT